MSGSTRKEGHSSRFHTGYRFVLGKQLREGTAGKRRENCGLKAFSSAHFGYINTVHDRGQHPDLIRLGPVHVLAGSSPPEVAAADHNSDLHAALYDFGDLGGDLSHRLFIEAVLFIACEGLPAQLQQNSAHNILHSFFCCNRLFLPVLSGKIIASLHADAQSLFPGIRHKQKKQRKDLQTSGQHIEHQHKFGQV